MAYSESVIAQRRNKQQFLARARQERRDRAEHGTTLAALVCLILSLGLSGLLAYLGRREWLPLPSIYNAALELRGKEHDVLQEPAWLRTGQTALAQRARRQDGPALSAGILARRHLLDIGLPDRPGLLVLQMLKENRLSRHRLRNKTARATGGTRYCSSWKRSSRKK